MARSMKDRISRLPYFSYFSAIELKCNSCSFSVARKNYIEFMNFTESYCIKLSVPVVLLMRYIEKSPITDIPQTNLANFLNLIHILERKMSN